MAVIAHSSMETDLRLAATLDQEVRALLTDQHAMRTVPGCIVYLGSVNGTGSDTKRVRFAGLDGYDAMTAAGESDVANTSLTDASADVAVASVAVEIADVPVAALEEGVTVSPAPVGEPESFDADDRETVSAALALVEPEPEPEPPCLRDRVRYRVGGSDDAPEMRDAEIASLGGRGISVLVFLDGQHDPGVDPGVRARGQPARSGECLAFRGVTEGRAVGQWSRPS